MLVEHVELFD